MSLVQIIKGIYLESTKKNITAKPTGRKRLKMKPIVFLAAALLAVSATPQGYYHQEYNYKTSSSSYKNNELQHQTDDRGYYSKSGDLEGRTKPKIKSDSEHSEYINPKIGGEGYQPQSSAYASASSFATASSASSDSDLNQQVEPLHPQQFVGQAMDDSDDTQQHMVGQEEMGQEELDLGQIEDSSEGRNPINTNFGGFTSFQVGHQQKPTHSYAGAVSGQQQTRPQNKPDVQITNFELPDESWPNLQTGSQIQRHPSQPQRGDQPPSVGQYPNEGLITNEPEGYGPVQSTKPFAIPLYTGVLRPITTLKVTANQQLIIEDIQESLTTNIETLLNERVSGGKKTTQVYRQLLEELQNILGNHCKERLKNVSRTEYGTIEEYLQYNLYQKLVYELLQRGFTKDILELSTGRPVRPFPRPGENYDFIQGEINSGINQYAPRPYPNAPPFSNPKQEQDWLIDQLRKATTVKPLTESITGPITNNYQQPTLNFVEKYIPGLTASQFEAVRTLDVELHVYIIELLNKQVRLIEKQHLQPQEAYETVLRDLEEIIEEVIGGTMKGNKPELIRFNQLIKNKLPRKYLLQLEEYLSMTLNDSVTKHLKELYDIKIVEYHPASYESLQNQISDLTVDQYQILRQLDVELQKEILKLLNKQTNLAKQQNRSPQEAFTTILHNLEEEIEVWIQDTLTGTKSELQRFSGPVRNKLTPKQQLELKEYLNNALTGSVTEQLSAIYNVPVPKPEVPTWYQAPDYGTVKVHVSDLTMNDYAQLRDLDLQLQTLIRDLVDKQVKLAQQQHLSPETTYSLVLHTLEAEIETIVSDTLSGSNPKLQRYVLPLTNKLNTKQQQALNKYLNTLLSNSVADQLTTEYSLKAPKPQVVPEWYEAPEYGKVQVSDLTLNEYDQIKSLDVELQKHIKDLVDKEVKLLQNQQLTPDTIYTSVLHTLEAEIETLISESFSGSQSDVEQYVLPLKTILSKNQQQELKKYLNIVLEESVEQQLTKVYKIEAPKPQVTPSWYQAPTYDTIKDHVSDLTPNDYDQIKSLDVELQKQIRDLVDKEVKQLQKQHLTPDAIYISVLHTLEAEIETLTTDSLSGTKPDVQRYAWPLKKKINIKQQQQLKEYLNNILEESVTEQLTKVHKIEAPKPQVIPSWYQAPTYDIVKVQVSDLTPNDYDEIKSLDVELQKLVRDLVDKQVKLLQNQHKTTDTIYTSVLHTLEAEIESLIADSISGSRPEVQRYVLPLKRKLTPKQEQELKKYFKAVLDESVTEQLTKVHKIEAPKPQVIPSWYEAPTYETVKVEISDLTLDDYSQLQKLDVELQKLVRDLVEKQVTLVQQQQSPDAYNIVLHTLENEIENLIRETLKGSRPDLQNYAGPLKNNLTKKQQQQIKQYFSNILIDSVEKQLVEVYHIEEPTTSKFPSSESLQTKIPDLTQEEYQLVKKLNIQLQKYIDTITDKHVKLAKEQNKSPQEAYVTVLHILEAEIETIVKDALQGQVTELLPYTRPIKSKLSRKQIQRLNDYLNSALTESVSSQLREIYQTAQPTNPAPTSTYQTPPYSSLKKQIPHLSYSQYEIIKQLDTELQEYLNALVQRQIKLAQEQYVSDEETYITVLHTLEEEIDRLVGGTLNGHRPELLKFHSLIKNKLSRNQIQPLRKYLEAVLTNSVKEQLDNLYVSGETTPSRPSKPSIPSVPYVPSNPTTPLQPSVPSVPSYTSEPVHQIPTYESLQNQIPDLTTNQYETVKELDTELQDHINDLIQKQIKLAQQQHTSPEDAYVTVLHTLEAEIENLVQGSFGSNKPEYKKYATLIRDKFNKAQHQQLKEYLSISLSQTVTQYLRQVYVNVVPQNVLPIYATPEYELLQEEIGDLTLPQYESVKELNVNLQEYLNDIIQKQVQLVQKQSLSPEESYKIILTTLESEIETLVPGTIQGNRPELQAFSNLVKHKKLSNKQLQQLQEYLTITLKLTVKRHLLRIYNLTEQTTYIYKPQYKVIRVKLENITTAQYNIIKKLEEEFSQIVQHAINNEDLSEHGDLSSYDKYQILSKKIENDLHKNLTDFIMGTQEPGLSKYSELVDRNFEKSKIPDVEKYIEIRLIKKIRDALTQKYNVGSFTSGAAVNSAYQYQTNKQITTKYGNVQQINQDSEQTQELKPVVYQHATVVKSAPQTHHFSNSEADDVEVFSPSSEPPQTTTEASGWWSSFGNKVKSIKQKIVG
ncbi:hypothetical protein GWI33_022301 [Rhynchophorus ferrugineus]|uniref:Uncharacterized protein n=1 Tax=Rhynchophorus ferrugineus TaxID=354439 RepID=A0A834IUV2_RHYFE|nr:hypothetical protein GWI33_022301 [Rhynchophorus ferrugineus]